MSDRTSRPHRLGPWTSGLLSTLVLVLAATALAPRATAQEPNSGCTVCGVWVTPCHKAQPGECVRSASKCDPKTERALEQAIQGEIKIQKEIWASGEQDLTQADTAISEIIRHALIQTGQEALETYLVHKVLHSLAAGAATPVLVAELAAHSFNAGLEADEIMQVWNDAQKKNARAMSDAETLGKKIDRDLAALEKCRAGTSTSLRPERGPVVCHAVA